MLPFATHSRSALRALRQMLGQRHRMHACTTTASIDAINFHLSRLNALCGTRKRKEKKCLSGRRSNRRGIFDILFTFISIPISSTFPGRLHSTRFTVRSVHVTSYRVDEIVLSPTLALWECASPDRSTVGCCVTQRKRSERKWIEGNLKNK